MSSPREPRREHPSTYPVQDRSNEEELARLHIQDQMLTTSMGGPLPEQENPTSLRKVLDVGCGTGDWLIETAEAYPEIVLLIGADVSARMVEFAREQARQVADRVEFHTMDALRMLEFPAGYFDLVNQRLGMSYLRTWDWPRLLQEYQRVTRPGGTVRITELETNAETSSPAMTQLYEVMKNAFVQAGHYFAAEGKNSVGVTDHIAPLLRQLGYSNVQTRLHRIEFRPDTPAGQHYTEDMARLFRTNAPFLRKWTRMPSDYEAIYQQALHEMQQPDFVAYWRLLTTWGKV